MDRRLRKSRTVHQRISIELDLYLKNFAKKNELSIPDASKEMAKFFKNLENNGGLKKIIKNLEF